MKETTDSFDDFNTISGDEEEQVWWSESPMTKWDHDIHDLKFTLSRMKTDRPTLKTFMETIETMIMDMEAAASFEDCEKQDLTNYGER